MQDSSVISVNALTKQYSVGYENLLILDNINFKASPSELIMVCGPSGSGKTTLIALLGALDIDYFGSLRIKNKEIKNLNLRERSELRRNEVSMVFQDYRLLSELSASENIEAPLYLQSYTKLERKAKVSDALALVNLSNREKHKPHQLSGGEKQRVAIARALVGGSSIILCDEPTGNLNQEISQKIFSLLRFLSHEYNKTIIVTSHDPKAKDYADRIINLASGALTEIV